MWSLLITYLVGPLVKLAGFLTTRGGTILAAATTFTGLVASLYALVSSHASGISDFIQPVTNAAQSMRAYLSDVGSIAQAVMYYTACDQLYLSLSTFATALLGILSAALLVAVSLLFAAMLPVLITHITSYIVRHTTS